MLNFTYSLIAALLVSLLSLVGVIVLALRTRVIDKIILFFIGFSAGALLGGAFLHLLPEALEEFGDSSRVFTYTLTGICLFFLLERVLRWHHCHQVGCETHRHLGYLNLVGDGVHNLIDGIIIVSSFSVSTSLGLAVTLSVALHEIPQEIGDFGVLLYAGFSKFKAIAYNLISALTAIVGVVLGSLLINNISDVNMFLLPFAAGGFIYIAASDLIPELHKEKDIKKSLVTFIFFILALIFMYVMRHTA